MQQPPTVITQTISHDDKQNSIHCCSSFYLLTTLKRHKSHLINILLIAQQTKESDQQWWSDKTSNSGQIKLCPYIHTVNKNTWPNLQKVHLHHNARKKMSYETGLLKYGFLVMAS